jgi:hypothetical protein
MIKDSGCLRPVVIRNSLVEVLSSKGAMIPGAFLAYRRVAETHRSVASVYLSTVYYSTQFGTATQIEQWIKFVALLSRINERKNTVQLIDFADAIQIHEIRWSD